MRVECRETGFFDYIELLNCQIGGCLSEKLSYIQSSICYGYFGGLWGNFLSPPQIFFEKNIFAITLSPPYYSKICVYVYIYTYLNIFLNMNKIPYFFLICI